MKFYESDFFHITCPNCGANMKIDKGSEFKCEYCKTALYVCPVGDIEMRAISLKENYKDFPEELRPKLVKRIDYEATTRLADDLINNREYCKKIVQPDLMSEANKHTYIVKFIKWRQDNGR